MSDKQDWIWYELMTTDPAAAARFYGAVVGWEITKYPAPDDAPQYWVCHAGGRGVAGIMNKPAEVPAHVSPNWSGYIHSANADSTAAAVQEAGGSILRAPFDIPGVGRIAVVADPQGGRFNLMQPTPQDAPPKLAQNTLGNVCWCELHSDSEDNFDFYQKLFGWQKVQAMDMGEFGVYQTFTTNDNPSTGGSMRKHATGPEAEMPTYWLFYFCVDGIDAAMARVQRSGGTIFMGPHQVPGDTWIALGRDPQGGVFALHSASK